MSNYYARSTRDTEIKSDKGLAQGEAIILGMHIGGTMEYSKASFRIDKDCIAITPKNEQYVLLKYIYYYLLANKKAWKRYYVGTIQRNLSKVDLQFTKIAYPPIELQHHIVVIFDLIYDFIEKRKDARKALHEFLLSYYQNLKNVSGLYWKKTLDVSKILTECHKDKKTKYGPTSQPFIPTHRGIRFVVDGQGYDFDINKGVCNPYFLAVALSASPKVARTFERTIKSNTNISLLHSQLTDITMALPNMEIQHEFEKRYKQIERIDETMCQFVQQVEILKETLLSSILSRDSETSAWKNENPQIVFHALETDKFTYEDFPKLTNLSEYDEKRDSLFELLEKGSLVQYFNEEERKVKFKVANLAKH